MKSLKVIFMASLVALLGLSACSAKSDKNESEAKEETKMLICYFSATGTTAEAAQRIADLTGGDLYEITPEQRYTDADLDWRNKKSRSSVEMQDSTSRPAYVKNVPDLKKYDVVLIGYPNWWNTHPSIIKTFIEGNDLKGKKIVPFMTSGGSDITNSEKELKESYPELTFAKGLLMNHVDDKEITDWLEGI